MARCESSHFFVCLYKKLPAKRTVGLLVVREGGKRKGEIYYGVLWKWLGHVLGYCWRYVQQPVRGRARRRTDGYGVIVHWLNQSSVKRKWDMHYE